MAVSIDICFAVARFLVGLEGKPAWVGVPPGFLETRTPTRRNPYPWARVRVRVALEYPRVTRDNH